MHKEKLFENAENSVIDHYTISSAVCAILNHEANGSIDQVAPESDKLISKASQNFLLNTQKERKIALKFSQNKKINEINVKYDKKSDEYEFKIENKTHKIKLIALDASKNQFQCDVDGRRLKFSYYKDKDSNQFFSFINDNVYEFHLDEPKFIKEQSDENTLLDANNAYSPMPGLIDKINVKIGDKIKKGDALVVMIAMKMEYIIRASKAGVVQNVLCNNGENVKKGAKLITIGDE